MTGVARIDRPRRVLRAFAASSDGMRTSVELIEDLGEKKSPRTMSWYGSILRRHEQSGFIERAASVKLGWGKGRIFLWKITDAGRREVCHWDDDAARKAEAVAAEEATAAAAATRSVALAAAREIYSRATPSDRRRCAALELRDLGCNYREIGEIFGVSREMIRQDLLPREDQNPGLSERKPEGNYKKPVWIRRGIRPGLIRRLEEGMLAGLTDVTLTEW